MNGLPNYTKPPVVEVAIGLQFAPLDNFSAAHIGLYWALIRDTFNRVEDQSPIEHIVEPLVEPQEIKPLFRMFTKPEPPRVWFIDSAGNKIIQVQHDRFLHNWRKMTEQDEYPRFPAVKKEFFDHWNQFCSFLEEQKLSPPQVDQCELTYVNLIRKGAGWESMSDLNNLFTFAKWHTRSNFLPAPENVRWSARFLLPEQSGRLHIEMLPVRIQPKNELALQLSLTTRGKPLTNMDSGSIIQWFDLAREWIVKGFADIVDKKTDRLWEKKE
ncbi:MAG: TIGR04255 family protein [Phycisphaerae bacterium]